MMLRVWDSFAWLFLPADYPGSVAPEYAKYQLWDTIQQVVYFVNTVISQQAVMKFHGVGNPSMTAAEASALSMGRSLLGSIVSLAFTTPAMVQRYKVHVVRARLSAECLTAAGHAQEIAAASVNYPALLYSGPVCMQIAGACGGASRSVIMSHFARANNNGDVSLKESNQDKGGKIFGLLFGFGVLSWINMSSNSTHSEDAALEKSTIIFGCLTVLHIMGNVLAVRTLDILPPRVPTNHVAKKPGQGGALRAFKSLVLPPGYPCSLADGYMKYAFFQGLCDMTLYPKGLVTQLFFWANVYGVGDASKTPEEAVYLSIFMMSIDCAAGLVSGIPVFAKYFYENPRVWRFRATCFGQVVGESLNLVAALAPPKYFYIIIVFSASLRSFGGLARKVVDATISKNWSRSPDVELVHVNIAARNQSVFVQMSTAVFSLTYAYYLVWTGKTPETKHLLIMYFMLQIVKLIGAWGCSMNVPEAPGDVTYNQPLISRSSSSASIDCNPNVEEKFAEGINEQNLSNVKADVLAGPGLPRPN